MIVIEAASYGVAFAAGMLSTLSPCVLPLVPILAASAFSAHRFGTVALAGGVGLSFASVGVFIATIGASIGLTDDVFRDVGAVLLLSFGLVMVSRHLQQAFARVMSVFGGTAQAALTRMKGDSLPGQFAIGLLLGVVWSPCVGPTLGAATTLAAQGKDLLYIVVLMGAFGVAAAFPLLVLGSVSHATIARMRGRLGTAGSFGQRALGGLFIVVGGLVLSGTDKAVEAALLSVSPAWLTQLTTFF